MVYTLTLAPMVYCFVLSLWSVSLTANILQIRSHSYTRLHLFTHKHNLTR